MNMKKIMASITAVIMLAGSITVSADNDTQETSVSVDLSTPKHTYSHGNFYDIPFDLNSTADLTPGEFPIAGTDVKWVYENHEGNGKKGRAKITTTNAATGDRALYLFAQNGGGGELYNPGAKMTIHLGELTGNGTYEVQFDMMPWDADYRDYVAMNMDGWDGAAKIADGAGGTIWSKGPAFQGSKHGDNRDFYTYTGTVSTENSPELSFAVWGYSRMTIDNIIVKDSTGTIVFSEGFEGGIPEGWVPPAEPDEPDVPDVPDEPDVPVEPDEPEEQAGVESTFVQGKYYEMPLGVDTYFTAGEFPISDNSNEKWVLNLTSDGINQNKCKVLVNNAATGGRCLYLAAREGGAGSEGSAKMSVHFGNLTGDGTYTIEFKMAREQTDSSDYIALNMNGWDGSARLNSNTTWIQGDRITPSLGSQVWYNYTGTLSTTEDPVLNIGVYGYAMMFIDDIVIKDSTGKVVFTEGFEGKMPDYACSEFGLFMNEEEQYAIESSKTYTVKASVINTKINNFTAQIFAVLRKDGEMVDIQGSGVESIPKNSTNLEGTEVSTTISVGDLASGEYELTIYLWDGLGKMKIIERSKLYTESV